jgi:predicted Zn-dependent protease
LARSLLQWSDAHPDRISPADRLTIAVWRAAALLHAGQPDQALERYDECAALADRVTVPDDGRRIDIRLGRAEALLEAGKPDRALPLFADLRRGLSEETPAWWRAFVGQLRCHTAIGDDADGLLQAIRQRRYLAPDLGGPRYRRMVENLEQANLARTTQPTGRLVPETPEIPK